MKCELCELLLTGYVTAIEQQLGRAMYFDRAIRFGGNVDEARALLEKAQADAAQTWENLCDHMSSH